MREPQPRVLGKGAGRADDLWVESSDEYTVVCNDESLIDCTRLFNRGRKTPT